MVKKRGRPPKNPSQHQVVDDSAVNGSLEDGEAVGIEGGERAEGKFQGPSSSRLLGDFLEHFIPNFTIEDEFEEAGEVLQEAMAGPKPDHPSPVKKPPGMSTNGAKLPGNSWRNKDVMGHKGMKLDYVNDTDDEPVDIKLEDIAKELEYWKFTLVGCVSVHNWCKEADALKERIRKELNEKFTKEYSLDEQLNLIDVIQRLGIAYHFEGDIHQAMQQIFDHHDNNHVDDHDHDQNHDLHTTSIRFRLLREHGFNVSCDVFNKFKDQKGNFKESLASDVLGVLGLYEASHLRVHVEDILEEALIFSSSHLQSMVPKLKPSIAKQVIHALRQPIRKGLTRLHAWDYFTFYQENESHDEVLFRFAKLDFNILQNQHRKELSILAKWWKRLDFKKNLPFARDRLVECYFWILGVYYEPQYALARNFLTKVIALTSTIDYIYDVYGTKRELELFTEAIESKVPTMEEYMKVALVSSGYQLLAIASLVGIGEIATKTTFDWLDTEPRILQASCLIARLMDDIVSHKFEQEREHIPSAVECYMNQHEVSDKQACIELNKQVVDAWKDINEAFTKRPMEIVMPVLTCLLNLSKVIDLLYTDEDGYTNVGPRLKHYVACMFINPIIV